MKRDKDLSDVPGNFKFYPCHDFLARMEKKCVSITRRLELALYLTNWLSEAVFTGVGSKKIRATVIY